MIKSPSDSNTSRIYKPSTSNEATSRRLRAEAMAPYRGLRQFIYFACAASAAIGGFIFFFKLLAGQEIRSTLPNFALQMGVLALMVWLFRLEQRKQ